VNFKVDPPQKMMTISQRFSIISAVEMENLINSFEKAEITSLITEQSTYGLYVCVLIGRCLLMMDLNAKHCHHHHFHFQ
jgi:hypothetical protein